MRFAWCVAVCISISLTSGPAAVTPAEDQAGQPDQVSRLIEQLGDDHFKVREEATRQLWALGTGAEPRLRAALGGTNPEVSKRASLLLRKIALDVRPDTPEAVLGLIERFNQAGRDDKLRIIYELEGLKAWRQILKLYSLETNEDVKVRVRSRVEQVAIRAARESIAAEKSQEALGFLAMGPKGSAGLGAIAEFHRTHGSLNAELAKATGPEQVNLRLALLRSSGQLDAARKAAVEARELRIAAVMDMLEGDPLPLLRTCKASDGPPSLHALYLQLAEKNWNGVPLTSKDFDPLQPFLRGSRNDPSRNLGIGIYFLLGEAAAGESHFIKLDPIEAFHSFRYFDLLERVPEALKVMGLNPDQPDYAAWVEKHAKAVIDHPDESDKEQNDLVEMAVFLEKRGLRDQLKHFEPFLAKLAAEDAEVFLTILNSLFRNEQTRSGAITLAKKAAVNYAGDDDVKWGEVLDGVFSDNQSAGTWWTWLGELDPAASRADRLDGLMALLRYGNDPGSLRKKWIKRVWDSIEAMPKDKAREKLNLMKDFALQSNDLDSGLKAWDQLFEDIEEDEEEDITDRSFSYLLYLSAAGRWQDAATLWMKRIEKNPSRPDFHAYAATCFRRMGKDQEAARQDDWAEKLALADPRAGIQIAQAYSFSGDFERAGQWWERVIVTTSPDSDLWVSALTLHGLDRTGAGDWKRAAAVNEVLAYNGYEDGFETPSLQLRLRVNADFTRALSRLKTDRERSIQVLERCHSLLPADGSLADYYFPALRKAGLLQQHDEWFERSWKIMESVIKTYPAGENSRNTAAWLAARAVRRLDEAEGQVDKALTASPEQAAYLDTKAEILFARKDRKGALELSKQSLVSDPLDDSLRRQFERYRTGPFPTP
jgi:hypothetical protein